ncbi:MAG: FecR family protein [Rhodothermaceae bacterium]
MDNEKLYISLIQKKLSGEISPEEVKQLEEIKNSSEENKRIYDEYKSLWQEIKPPFEEENFDTIAGWDNISEKLDFTETEIKTTGSYYKWYGIAASVLILLSLALYNFTGNNFTTFSNPNEKVKEFLLPDKSIVKLSKGSTLEFDWNEEPELREVKLTGDAFFVVFENKEVPFIVNTFNARTKVLGTSFLIDTEESKTILTVKSGRVEFKANKNDVGHIVKKNQQSFVRNTKEASVPIEINADFAVNKYLENYTFKSLSFANVLKFLQDDFNFTYRVNDEDVLRRKVTASFNKQDLQIIIESLCSALNLKFSQKDSEYYFYK